jgi:hypothetical protein
MRSLAIAVAIILGLSAGATAAEPPNLVGDWTRSVLSSAHLGEHPGYPPSGTTDIQQWPGGGLENEDR